MDFGFCPAYHGSHALVLASIFAITTILSNSGQARMRFFNISDFLKGSIAGGLFRVFPAVIFPVPRIVLKPFLLCQPLFFPVLRGRGQFFLLPQFFSDTLAIGIRAELLGFISRDKKSTARQARHRIHMFLQKAPQPELNGSNYK